MDEIQHDLVPEPGKGERPSPAFYLVTVFSGLVVLAQVVLLILSRGGGKAAQSEVTPTRPRPTRALVAAAVATATPTVKLPTNTPSPTWTVAPPTATPTPTEVPPTAVPSSTPTQTPVPCEAPLEARFVSDVTIPDYTAVKAGQQFDKTWRMANPGECAWPAGVSLAFVSGEQMGGPDAQPLASEVASGEEVDITVPMTAPSSPGTHKGRWQMRTAEGESFGGSVVVIVKVPGAQPQPAATPVRAPVEVLNRATVDNGEWGEGWIEVQYKSGPYYFSGNDGASYCGEIGFLSRPESLAKIRDIWSWAQRGGGNWTMTVLVREKVAWIACTGEDKVCYEHHTTPSQSNLTTKVFYRPEVWASLLDSDRAGGWQAVAQNAYYQQIQETVFYPIAEVVPDIPCIGFKFTPAN